MTNDERMTNAEFPGSTGCQPVVFGNLPKIVQEQHSSKAWWSHKELSASCRQLQAGSLRSPQVRASSFFLMQRKRISLSEQRSSLASPAKLARLQPLSPAQRLRRLLRHSARHCMRV